MINSNSAFLAIANILMAATPIIALTIAYLTQVR
jgi:hypothetical protein